MQQLYEEKEKLLKFFGYCDKSFYSKCINIMEEEFEEIKQLISKVGLRWFCDSCCLRYCEMVF